MCSLFLFGHPLLRAGRCLFLETLFSAILGVPRARPTPGASPPPPPTYPRLGPAALGRLPGSWPSKLAPGRPGVSCLLPPCGPGLRPELAGWARARSEVGVFCARAPPREGRSGDGRPRGGGLGRARPWLWSWLQASFRFPSGAGSAGSWRRVKLILLRSSRA